MAITTQLSTPAQTIDEVIAQLEAIINEASERQSPLGYFAVLYQQVTKQVKTGIAEGFFADGPRMERLDVIFANRYIDAYRAYHAGEACSASWKVAFDYGDRYWPIVLQHLMLGMNAHINLDLGIAAAEVSQGQDIRALQADFNKINEVLSALVNDVQARLASIWPRLTNILQRTQKADDLLVDFSMEVARNDAWAFACSLAELPTTQWPQAIAQRDQQVDTLTQLIIHRPLLFRLAFGIIRLGERDTVKVKIYRMKA